MAFLYDGSTLYWAGLLVLIAVLYLRYSKKKVKLPPGPVGLPILGCYLSLRKDPIKTITEMGHKYGNVFGFYLGRKYLVVLNDWDALTDGFSQSATLDRPPALFENIPYNLGFGGKNGFEWSYQRRLSSRAMKDIGLHRTRWEDAVQEEISEIVERILNHGRGPLEVRPYFLETFASNITSLILGERLPVGHRDTKMVAEALDDVLRLSPTLWIMNFSPTLGKILEVLGFEKKTQLQVKVENLAKFISDRVDEKIRNPDEESKDSFIEQFHFQLFNKKNEVENKYAEMNIKGNVLSLLTGGSETSQSSTIWSLVAMADHPEKQEKVHEELDRVLGKDGWLKWADRMKIPYTYAAFMESMRWRTLVPFSTLRIASEDMIVQGYHIPKGTFITSNFWAIHNDPRYWKDPEEFLPERFLVENGKKVNTSPDSYCPFSYGKRNCPGKLIALMENLPYFVSLMQKFKVVPKDGKKVKYNTFLGLTYQPENVELCFIPRQ